MSNPSEESKNRPSINHSPAAGYWMGRPRSLTTVPYVRTARGTAQRAPLFALRRSAPLLVEARALRQWQTCASALRRWRSGGHALRVAMARAGRGAHAWELARRGASRHCRAGWPKNYETRKSVLRSRCARAGQKTLPQARAARESSAERDSRVSWKGHVSCFSTHVLVMHRSLNTARSRI